MMAQRLKKTEHILTFLQRFLCCPVVVVCLLRRFSEKDNPGGLHVVDAERIALADFTDVLGTQVGGKFPGRRIESGHEVLVLEIFVILSLLVLEQTVLFVYFPCIVNDLERNRRSAPTSHSSSESYTKNATRGGPRAVLPYFGKWKQVTKVKFLVKERNVSVFSTDINGIS